MVPIFHQSTKASELVAWCAHLIAEKAALIAGISAGGLGKRYTKQIATASPGLFILAGRSLPKLEVIRADLNATHPDIKFKVIPLDLLSFANVRKAAATVSSWDDVTQIDLLVNNAGITEGAPRIMTVSRIVHRIGHTRWADYNFGDGEQYQRWLSYAQLKIGNALMGLLFAEKLGSRGLLSFPMCSGTSYTSLLAHGVSDLADFAADLTKTDNIYGNKWGCGMGELHFKDPDRRVNTHVFASSDMSIVGQNGTFMSDYHIADQTMEQVYPWATNKINAERLWRLSEKLVGRVFSY
ncbi:Short-chain dehydrogenase [Fusarium sp. Ph1]|nr:Short-chain dehydrogenase [Fusarium sp. Ph1]